MLTKDQIRLAQDRPREWVALEEWTPAGETFDAERHGVYVGTMSARDRDAWESRLFADKGGDESRNFNNLRARLAVHTVQDESGARVFTEDDTTWLADKAGSPLDAIFSVALKLNKLSKRDQDELVKN